MKKTNKIFLTASIAVVALFAVVLGVQYFFINPTDSAPELNVELANLTVTPEQYQENQQYEVVVYKSPTCGCCTSWVEAMKKIGYRMTVYTSDEQLRQIKQALNIPPDKQSCHTSTVAGYVLEGHVHPDSIARLLKEKSKIRGLYLPGMVVGSVGMEQGDLVERYAILSIDYDNQVSIYDIYN